MTPETMLLSHVDRLSGQGDLVVRQQAEEAVGEPGIRTWAAPS